MNSIHVFGNNRTTFFSPKDASEIAPLKNNLFFVFELLRSQAISPSKTPSEVESGNFFSYGERLSPCDKDIQTKASAIEFCFNKITYNNSILPPNMKERAKHVLKNLEKTRAPLSSEARLGMNYLKKFTAQDQKDIDFTSFMNNLFLKELTTGYENFYRSMNIPEVEGRELFGIFHNKFRNTMKPTSLTLCEKCIDVARTAIASQVYKFIPSKWNPSDSITTFINFLQDFGPCMIMLSRSTKLFHQPAIPFGQLRGVDLFKHDQTRSFDETKDCQDIVIIGAAIHNERNLVYYLNNIEPSKVFVLDYETIQEKASFFYVYSLKNLTLVFACHNEKKSPEEHAKRIWEHNTPAMLKKLRESGIKKLAD